MVSFFVCVPRGHLSGTVSFKELEWLLAVPAEPQQATAAEGPSSESFNDVPDIRVWLQRQFLPVSGPHLASCTPTHLTLRASCCQSLSRAQSLMHCG
jgi:hypothetical protein